MSDGLFKESKSDYLSEIISFRNPEEAKDSVEQLKEEFKYSETNDKRLRIKRATLYASNRAKAILNKEDLSSKEREEFKEISKIYRKAYDEMKMPKVDT
jgi:hypothetical protein